MKQQIEIFIQKFCFSLNKRTDFYNDELTYFLIKREIDLFFNKLIAPFRKIKIEFLRFLFAVRTAEDVREQKPLCKEFVTRKRLLRLIGQSGYKGCRYL